MRLEQIQTVADAAVMLDEVMPKWFNVIDLRTLNMASTTTCILGQLYGSYRVGKSKLIDNPDISGGSGFPTIVADIFCYFQFEEQWINEIKNRRNPPVKAKPTKAAKVELTALEAKTLAKILATFDTADANALIVKLLKIAGEL